MADASLVVRGLNVAYGESKVLFDVDFHVAPNQIVCCVGRNGAGKTTLLRSIAGFLRPTSGEATAGGVNLVGHRPYDVARMGVKYVPQDKKVFSDLTVRENLELGSYATRDYNWDRVFEYFPKLKILIDRKAGFLSGGERQMLMIGRATLGNPKVMLIDEPTEGLAPVIIQQIGKTIGILKQQGFTILLVEQNFRFASTVAGNPVTEADQQARQDAGGEQRHGGLLRGQ